jgi:hypothetical protein
MPCREASRTIAALQLRRSKTSHRFRLPGKPAKSPQVQIFFTGNVSTSRCQRYWRHNGFQIGLCTVWRRLLI